ncbi:hypothetical protein N7468_006652 [Penicillium chermesinum]|uniref:Uncharacterized protein n=1 Tax=Penicillium chermesinum TaxID=63820 RepID=A0A9W9NSM7_9EURO|nr:uncharacterized protein N7468_006652 [Penicillium chermesinum]KAJ5225427.1 hypothetical protein N7468_006652 [Penicillium chermesinum]KAJ6161348.1 hypothetical protein N7470_004744 [Penicillium chermesinum]
MKFSYDLLYGDSLNTIEISDELDCKIEVHSRHLSKVAPSLATKTRYETIGYVSPPRAKHVFMQTIRLHLVEGFTTYGSLQGFARWIYTQKIGWGDDHESVITRCIELVQFADLYQISSREAATVHHLMTLSRERGDGFIAWKEGILLECHIFAAMQLHPMRRSIVRATVYNYFSWPPCISNAVKKCPLYGCAPSYYIYRERWLCGPQLELPGSTDQPRSQCAS